VHAALAAAATDGGITVHTEKVLLKTVRGYVRRAVAQTGVR
jgi:hypothetical protein